MKKERTNEEWLAHLRGPGQNEALDDLRTILVRGLRYALSNKVNPNQLDDLIEDSVQDALLKILAGLDTFEGRSRFTTWANKIAVRVAYSELRRQRWKDVSLEDLLPEDHSIDYTPAALTDPAPNPEEAVTQTVVLGMVRRIINEELTERQRTALRAVMLKGMPLEEVARRMDTNRNALYKLLHDARKRLKERITQEGFTPEELLAAFELEQ